MQALQNRNLTAHTYDEKMAEKVAHEIEHVYYPLIFEIYTKLKSEL